MDIRYLRRTQISWHVIFDDLKVGEYKEINDKLEFIKARGEISYEEAVTKMNKVSDLASKSNILIKEIDFEIKSGIYLMINGPNRCSKSSILTIISQLWPLFVGLATESKKDTFISIPQLPYFQKDSLRGQIICLDTKNGMIR